jgi:lipoprotein-anchoring transpeptidase ErfK/SrfK
MLYEERAAAPVPPPNQGVPMRVVRALSLLLVAAFIAVFCGGAAAGGQAVAATPVAEPLVALPAAPRVPAAPAAPAVAPAPAVPAPAPPAPFVVPGTPCQSTARACVDLSANRAWLLRNGAIEYGPVPITSGRKGYRTPPGTFAVTFRNRDHVSSIYGAPMPYSVFFNGGIAFHQGSLRERSHGCIHLSRAAAKTFFAALRRGDVVQVVR